MSREHWQQTPAPGPPEKVEHEDQVHFVRRVPVYELGLAGEQCHAWCGCDIESMGSASSMQQIRAVAFFATWALCDESGQPYFDAGPRPEASAEFLEQVETIARHPVDLTTKLAMAFIKINAPPINGELTERAKKNLRAIKSDAGRSARPPGAASVAGSGLVD